MTNTENTNDKKFNFKMLTAFLLGVMLVYSIVSVVVKERLSDLQLETKVLISEQETRLASIAVTTARNGADDVTEKIIRDCSPADRIMFDQLLGSLDNGLPKAQLIELERLFGRCGNFFAKRKSVMASRFEREVEIYETFIHQLSNISRDDKLSEYKVEEWKNLASLETKQSELFSELVNVQDEIITELIAGNSAASEEIVGILHEAAAINDNLSVTINQSSNLRSTLVSL